MPKPVGSYPDAVAEAYSLTGRRWQAGPGVIYDRLADELVRCSPVTLEGVVAIDVGAGAGAATRAAVRRGARRVVAIDSASTLLAAGDLGGNPAMVGDATRLPVRTGSVDVAIAAFSLNHLLDPAAGFAELRRVVRQGGAVLVSTYAADDSHPVKAAVESVLAERGWTADGWYRRMRGQTAPQLATVDGCCAAARAGGLDPRVSHLRVAFPDLDPGQLVAWRLGMAQHAPFVDRMSQRDRAQVAPAVLERLGGDPATLVRSILVVTAKVAHPSRTEPTSDVISPT